MPTGTRTIKRRNVKRNGTHGPHTWGTGPTYDAFALLGMMACGVLPKSGKTLDKAFESGHAQSENGSAKLVRPSRLAYETAQMIAGNPEKYARVLAKLGLDKHLIG